MRIKRKIKLEITTSLKYLGNQRPYSENFEYSKGFFSLEIKLEALTETDKINIKSGVQTKLFDKSSYCSGFS